MKTAYVQVFSDPSKPRAVVVKVDARHREISREEVLKTQVGEKVSRLKGAGVMVSYYPR